MATQQGIQELHRTAILQMLKLEDGGEQSWGGAQTWKVLVYDKFCQEVVAPLLKVGGLRNHGVSLNQALTSERHPLPDVPAVYFVEPTEDNIKRIGQDLAKGLYESCYINFASAVPRSLLEELARSAMQAGAAHKIAGVFDRYVSFTSLSSSIFSLNLPEAYATIHSPNIAENMIHAYIERIVDGLLSVLITQRIVPIIRCPPNEVAEMVARRLEERIRELINRGGASAELFSSRQDGPAASSQRPLLCILDREVDMITMLNHTWTYQAMVHDVLGMRLNKVMVPVDTGDTAAPPKLSSYDVDETDAFWKANAGEPWPAAAGAVHEALEEFNNQRESMNKSGADEDDPTQSLTTGIAAALNALPEMTERKRSIDMHTNIATALVSEVRARGLDRYYELEDQFSSQSLGSSITALSELITDGSGTVLDKTRALMVLYMTKPSITPAQLQGLMDGLQAINGDVSGMNYLKHLTSMRSMMAPAMAAQPTSAPAGSSLLSQFGGIGGLAEKMRASGETFLAAGLSNIKNIVASKKELVICQILDSLMEQKPSPSTENYLYLDPKAPPAVGGEVPRVRAPFRRAVTFVVGGGNYAEMQSVQEWAQANGRQVTYGSTDMVSPAQFVDELDALGRAQGGGGGGGAEDLR
mmetsp:Transcript_6682/g.17027  ORF Transcript_6682/g.17027 Transcript_6682/m.17027 type:complete len:642 (-) Transcript_6682:41-1966(-)